MKNFIKFIEINMKKFPFTSILGWSSSRYDVFSTCKRKYYYRYYAKHDTDFALDQINRLKQLTTVPLTVGSIAHDVIETLLKRLQKSDADIDTSRLKEHIAKMVEDTIQKSKFFEIYYQKQEELDKESMVEAIYKCLQLFIESDRYAWINQQPMEQRHKWVIEPPGFGETRINDLKAYCKVDCMIPTEEGVYIFDWKTGKNDVSKHRKQLIGYSLYAHNNFGHAEKDIRAFLVYLKDEFDEAELELQEGEVKQFYETLADDTTEMQSYCTDVDKNTPKGKDEFEMIDSGLCGYCEFKELCGK
ncbi:PD-(D/E)XK nuclease family protein [Crocinitomicaceae bacterium]|nr:PD-(D/E)XK nuclease family protein [Crocinitomicaceae bacterium]